MKKYLAILFLFFCQIVTAQKIINFALVDDKGITEDATKAKYLILIKTFGDTAFERLEYNFTGPMIKRLTYKDHTCKILNGSFTKFFPSGIVESQGDYMENKKNGSWYFYNDTAHAIKEYKYHLDTLLAVINLDSLELEKKKIIIDTTGEREAIYNGGPKNYSNFISKNLNIPDRTQSLQAGGTVQVKFVVDKEGKVTNIKIWKSVEFAFDEEVMRVVALAKDWIPAIQKGRKVNAYRIQPVTLSFK